MIVFAVSQVKFFFSKARLLNDKQRFSVVFPFGSLRKHPFLLARRRCGRSSARNVHSGEERGETDVFAGYPFGGECVFVVGQVNFFFSKARLLNDKQRFY